MFKKLIAKGVLLSFSMMMVGCASIVGQSSFPVTINSNPSEAKVTIKDERGIEVFAGKTPTVVTLAAGESYFHSKTYDLTFSKEGFSDQHAQVRAEISGWYFGNLLFGGFIGFLIVDPITGKMWKLPASTFANLNEKTASNNKHPVLQIATIDQVPEDMRKNLVRIN